MALVIQTFRPSSTPQFNGTYATLIGAASANAAFSDNSDSSYVTISNRCRLDTQVLRVAFPTPTLPAGARVYSVTLRRRVQNVILSTPQSPPPTCLHWFRCSSGTVNISGEATEISKTYFSSPCPVTTTATTAWVNETLGSYTTAPGGAAWDPATTLNGIAYEMGRGDDTGIAMNVSEVYIDIAYQQLSAVSVTGPTGTVTTTRPTITWTYSSPDSQPQLGWRVMVYTAAQVAALGFAPFTTAPLQDSGVQIGEDQAWTLTADLVDGSYSAYVQATATWSGAGSAFTTAIASTSWTRFVAPAPVPPPPVATLSTAVFDAVNNRVALTMVPSGSLPVTTAFTVFASRDNGVTFVPIPSLTLVAANGMTPVTFYDYVAPINVISQYRVMAYSQGSGVYTAAAMFSAILSVTTTGSDWWLKDPANPLTNTLLPVAAPSQTGADGGLKIIRRRMQGTFEPLSGLLDDVVYPIIVSGPYYGERGELELIFTHDQPVDYFPAFDALDRSGHVLLLQKPNGDQLFCVLGPGSGGQDTELHYDAIAGAPSQILYRRVKTSYTQTNVPAYY